MILSAKPSRRRVLAELLALAAVLAFGLVIEDHLNPDLVRSIVVGCVVLAWVTSIMFVAYFSRSPWRKAPATRALMGMAVALAALTSLVLSGYIFPVDHPGRTTLRLAVYAGVVYALARMTIVLRIEQIRASRHPLVEGERAPHH